MRVEGGDPGVPGRTGLGGGPWQSPPMPDILLGSSFYTRHSSLVSIMEIWEKAFPWDMGLLQKVQEVYSASFHLLGQATATESEASTTTTTNKTPGLPEDFDF